MLSRLFLVTFLLLLMANVSYADDEIDSSDGTVRVPPQTSESVFSLPMDLENGGINWQEYFSLPPGIGAQFGFITVLYPPDPSALADTPGLLLDGAWLPPVPFSFGYSPPSSGNVTTRGWWYLEDSTGLLARRDMEILIDGNSTIASTWFLGGTKLYHAELGWMEGYISETYYLPDEWYAGGIDYFLRSVWFRGILKGERLDTLLQVCGAVQVGRDMIAGTRNGLMIYKIPANELDRQNGRGSLLVWITLQDRRIVRTRLHATYATEVTEYENISVEVQNDPTVFYNEFLPTDIYWSIDNYLLTHETPFWDYPTTDFTYNAAPTEFTFNADTLDDSESADEESTDDSGDSESSE
ncbi:MAG TPA: hypothetical protein VGB30_02365 [bacterium]|jgi:hypothetical protein